MAEGEHWTEGMVFAVPASFKVAGILGFKNVGSLFIKLGEVNLVLDQNCKLLGVFQDSSVVERSQVIFYRTPGKYLACAGSHVTLAGEYAVT